jgi:hypothetical protein
VTIESSQMPFLTHLADRVIGRPLLVHPDKMQVVLMALQERIGVAWEADALSPEASRFRGRRSESFPYRVENGAAILSIVGSLVNRGAWVGASSGLTS